MRNVLTILELLGVGSIAQITIAMTSAGVGGSHSSASQTAWEVKGGYAAVCGGQSVSVTRDEAIALIRAGAGNKTKLTEHG
jgi:hypothetical protein